MFVSFIIIIIIDGLFSCYRGCSFYLCFFSNSLSHLFGYTVFSFSFLFSFMDGRNLCIWYFIFVPLVILIINLGLEE